MTWQSGSSSGGGGGRLAAGGSPPPPGGKGRHGWRRGDQSHREQCQRCELDCRFQHANLRFSCVSESTVQPQVQTPPDGKYSRPKAARKRCVRGRLDE